MLSPKIFNYAMQNGMRIEDVKTIVQMVEEEKEKQFRAERRKLSSSLRKRGLCIRCAEESKDSSLCDECKLA